MQTTVNQARTRAAIAVRHGEFHDRRHAGQILANMLSSFANQADVIVLALPRGGVPIGFEIARALRVPLDVFVVRKLGVPFQPELAMGAIASGGVRVLNDDVVRNCRISPDEIERVQRIEFEELKRREQIFRGDRAAIDVSRRRVILVDDGLATGSSMRAAIAALRTLHPAQIIVAVPVSARDTRAEIARQVDQVICPLTPDDFGAVGYHYQDFSQTTDDEVRDLLQQSRALSSTIIPTVGGSS